MVDLKSNKNLDQLKSGKNCDSIFSIFLYFSSRFCNEDFYQLIAVFLKALRECLNKYGYTQIKETVKE